MAICPKCNHKFRAPKGNKKYKKGASYEYIVQNKLREKGYEVHRAYASRGVYDLIALKDGVTLGIQVKSLSQKNKSYLTPKDRDSLNREWINGNNALMNPYVLLTWDKIKHAAVELNVCRPIHIIHAYKEGPLTKWAQLIGIDQWIPFKP